MKMSMSIPSFACVTILPLQKELKARPRLEIRAQSLQDEGKTSNMFFRYSKVSWVSFSIS